MAAAWQHGQQRGDLDGSLVAAAVAAWQQCAGRAIVLPWPWHQHAALRGRDVTIINKGGGGGGRGGRGDCCSDCNDEGNGGRRWLGGGGGSVVVCVASMEVEGCCAGNSIIAPCLPQPPLPSPSQQLPRGWAYNGNNYSGCSGQDGHHWTRRG